MIYWEAADGLWRSTRHQTNAGEWKDSHYRLDVNGDKSELEVCMQLVFWWREYSTSFDLPSCVMAFIILFEECSFHRLQDVKRNKSFSVKFQKP